jgi:hypothetical protein
VARIGGNTDHANDMKISDSSRSKMPSYTGGKLTAI